MLDSIEKKPSCADKNEINILSVKEAQNAIFDLITPLDTAEKKPLRDTLDRVLAQDIHSHINVPGHTNSAMDGYALSGKSLPRTGIKSFKVIATSFAGKPFKGTCAENQCIRIMTGAAMPEGTDTVVMQEHVELENDIIKIDNSHQPSQNVRQAGEDIAINDLVLRVGKKLVPSDLGIIASIGVAEVAVRRRPIVAFFSTGDELRSIGDGLNKPLELGEIYDSNRYSLFAMLSRLNVEIIDLGVIEDNEDAIKNAFTQASDMADVVITSGGVSVGEADFIKPVLEELGDLHFWKISMKPGRPLTFGYINDSILFGLPGNPVSVMVTFYQFVLPALHYLSSGQIKKPFLLNATCLSKLDKRSSRYEFQRGVYSQSESGEISVTKTGEQGSGILTSMSNANCFILLDEQCHNISKGEAVLIQPFDGLI